MVLWIKGALNVSETPPDRSVSSDIRELIQVDDVMEDHSLRFGPNGGLVFCMEYFANNFDWLEESLGHVEDDYILFDCPGEHTQTVLCLILVISDSKASGLFVEQTP